MGRHLHLCCVCLTFSRRSCFWNFLISILQKNANSICRTAISNEKSKFQICIPNQTLNAFINFYTPIDYGARVLCYCQHARQVYFHFDAQYCPHAVTPRWHNFANRFHRDLVLLSRRHRNSTRRTRYNLILFIQKGKLGSQNKINIRLANPNFHLVSITFASQMQNINDLYSV
jgi:hypothetical protein